MQSAAEASTRPDASKIPENKTAVQKSDGVQRQSGLQLLPATFCQKLFPISYAERQQYLLIIKD